MRYLRPLCLIFFTLLIGAVSSAEITITRISGASEKDVDSDGTSIAYGGTAGTCDEDEDTCDSCTGGLDTPCNNNRIDDNDGQLTVTFTTSEAGDAFVENSADAKVTNWDTINSVNAGDTVSLSIDWEDLCDEVNGAAAACNTIDGNESFTVGVDTNGDGELDDTATLAVYIASEFETTDAGGSFTVDNTAEYGIDEYEIFPGDEKVYLIEIGALNNFPNGKGVADFEKIRVYYNEVGENAVCTDGSWDTILNNSSHIETRIEEISGTDKVEPADEFHTGFVNGQRYAFKLALVDQAGNVSWFLHEDLCIESNHYTTPDEVYGLLDEGANCFITTASYGSPLAPKVQTFRTFRDKILRRLPYGKSLVKTYYKYSPYAAKVIQDNPTLKKISQILLWPLWVVAAVAIGVPSSLLLAILILPSLIMLSYIWVLIRKKDEGLFE